MIKYTLELVIKAQSDEGITPALLPPVQIMNAESLFGVLVQAKYMVIDASPDLDDMDEDKLLVLASKVQQDVTDGKYKWVSVEE